MWGKLFWLAFAALIAIFIVVNVLDYWWTEPPCCDFMAEFGVPIAFGRTGGFVGVTVINWVKLFLNAVIATGMSVLLALIVESAIQVASRYWR